MPRPASTTSIGVRAPVRELGAVLGGALTPAGMAPWTSFVDDQEYVPELAWPRSVLTYDEMRTDVQLSALFKATTLGVRRFKWSIDPNGADDDMVRKCSEDYNLPILGEKVNTRKRAKRRFSFADHMRKAMYAGIWGHYAFEQVGTIGDDGMWHLRKLAERPPRTIQDFRVAEDGGLVSIVQNIARGGNVSWMSPLPEIPVDNLLVYVNEREGANWAGRSWFRDCYKPWVIKDRLVRIDAINHERAGGVPYIEAHPGATYAEIDRLNEMARGFRIGDTSGGAVPAGAKFNIARGTNSSVVESIRYCDEAMARNWMLMVMQLGQTQTGSRALGTTFVDFWADGLASIADWFRDTFNEFMIEDDIDWNWGEDVEQVPMLTYEFDPELVVADLATAVEKGVIVMDDDLEAYARKEMGLTEKSTPRPDQKLQLEQDRLDQERELAEQNAEREDARAERAAQASQTGTPTPVQASAGEAEGAPSRPQPADAQSSDELESPTD